MLKVNDIIIEGEICTLDCECPKLVSKPKFSLKLNLRTFEFFSDLENNQRKRCPRCRNRVYAREGLIINQPLKADDC